MQTKAYRKKKYIKLTINIYKFFWTVLQLKTSYLYFRHKARNKHESSSPKVY